MSLSISPIIQVSELKKLHKSENVILVDVRNGKNAKSDYEAKHLEGAIFLDLNTQLSEIKQDLSIGGRHPLPKIENFAETLSSIGITQESHVVIYDDKNGSNAAARFWWMLKSIGHHKVQVLNGGIQEAEKNTFPMSSKTEPIKKTEKLYAIDNWKLQIAEIEYVEKVSQSKNHLLIDVRSAERYNGETEPIDLIAGHIPGAINIPFAENLDENGLFLAPDLLKQKYEKLFGNVEIENVIFHCGSGVTACHSLLAISYAEMEIPKLYVGSWSEWSRNNKTIEIEPSQE